MVTQFCSRWRTLFISINTALFVAHCGNAVGPPGSIDAMTVDTVQTNDQNSPEIDAPTLDLVDVPPAMDIGSDTFREDRPRIDAPLVDLTDVPPIQDTREVSLASALFDPCNTPMDCAAIPRGRCFSSAGTVGFPIGFPNGMCSAVCSTNSDCGTNGVCLDFGASRYCFPRCEQGFDCRNGYTCFPNAGPLDESVCWPLCTSNEQCGNSNYCHAYTGYCQARVPEYTQDPNGAPCQENSFGGSNCRGNCLPESSYDPEQQRDIPSGYIDGMCYSMCVVPPEWSQPTLRRYPQGSCPMNSVCIPWEFSIAQSGDLGYCVPECTDDSQCRAGYQCFRRTFGGQTPENGFCTRMDCNDGTHRCPVGFQCQLGIDPEEPSQGRCVRQ